MSPDAVAVVVEHVLDLVILLELNYWGPAAGPPAPNLCSGVRVLVCIVSLVGWLNLEIAAKVGAGMYILCNAGASVALLGCVGLVGRLNLEIAAKVGAGMYILCNAGASVALLGYVGRLGRDGYRAGRHLLVGYRPCREARLGRWWPG